MSDPVNPFARDPNASNQSTQQQYDVAQQNRAREKKSWALVFAAICGIFLIGLVCCGGVAFFAWQFGGEMLGEPVNAAIAYVSADEEIANKLGTPIESTSALGIENYENNNGNGGAKVGFNAKGPNGTARVDGELTLTAGTWSVKNLKVKFSDGSVITLPRPADPDPVDGAVDESPEADATDEVDAQEPADAS